MSDKECDIPARFVLWILLFFGVALNALTSKGINIAIVSMVKPTGLVNGTTEHYGECFEVKQTDNLTDNNVHYNISGYEKHMEEKFEWNKYEQNSVLGSFFWLFWAFPLLSGLLIQRFGTKLVFGVGNSLGIALTYFITAELINLFDWPAVFYFNGICGILWYVAWLLLAYDTPAQHPRISHKELKYITENLGHVKIKKTFQVPWRNILTSCPVWINIFAMSGAIYSYMIFTVELPTYFNEIHGWSIRKNGFFSGFPHFVRMTVTFTASTFFDYLLKKKLMNRTNVRKLATAICTVVQAVLVAGLAFAGCNKMYVIICMVLAMALGGTFTSGPSASFVDLSPNYSSVLQSLNLIFNAFVGIVAPMIIAELTYENQTVRAWQTVYLVSAAITAIPGIIYILFASSELQAWNTIADPNIHVPEKESDTETTETLLPLERKENNE